MSEKKRSVEYAIKRMQAQRNVADHIDNTLYSAARRIVELSGEFIGTGGELLGEEVLTSLARNITAESESIISAWVERYCRASIRVLDSENDAITGLLDNPRFGRTFAERNADYLSNFAEDVVRMIKAGAALGYNNDQILSAVRTSYKDPYVNSVITKANAKGIFIETPSYGRGKMHAAYDNIIRNAQDTIAYAWGVQEGEDAQGKGAIGFKVFRGSSYPCAVCDDECGYIHDMQDQKPPYHNRCVCRVEYIYKK